jgi:hypothetical protein
VGVNCEIDDNTILVPTMISPDLDPSNLTTATTTTMWSDLSTVDISTTLWNDCNHRRANLSHSRDCLVIKCYDLNKSLYPAGAVNLIGPGVSVRSLGCLARSPQLGIGRHRLPAREQAAGAGSVASTCMTILADVNG